MYRSTTPIVILRIKNEDFDLDLVKTCHVTIESELGLKKLIIEETKLNNEDKTISFNLTQKQTLDFSVGKIKIQLKVKLRGGSVIPSKIIETTMKEILEEEEL